MEFIRQVVTMKIIVCVKQVPDAKDVRLDPVTNTLAREGVESIMNPYDQYALEEAVRLVETHGGEVTVITMGPPQAEEVLRQAISCGADQAVLISDRAFAGADTWATAYTLEKAVKNVGGPLILSSAASRPSTGIPPRSDRALRRALISRTSPASRRYARPTVRHWWSSG